MRIEIISTGDEIVTGLVVDTNAAWLSALLLEQGWQVRRGGAGVWRARAHCRRPHCSGGS